MTKRFSSKTIAQFLPSLNDYRLFPKNWKSDVLAGLTVGIVALPLALAFGVSSGVGAEAGIITAIIAGLVAAVFGGSNVQVSGPTGAMVVILLPIVANHGVQAIALVSLMAGVIVLATGIMRLGRSVSYIPWPVIEGFTAGIGVIIFAQQIPSALGVHLEKQSSNAMIAAFDAFQLASKSSLIPLLIVLATVAIIFIFERFLPGIPGSFIAIIIVTIVVFLAKLSAEPIGELPNSLPPPAMPYVSSELFMALLGPAFAVAALAAIESLLSARVAATIADTGPFNADRELVGQGLASIAAGFFGGMPATGAIARTAVGVRSGAKTRATAIIHALFLLIMVLFAAGLVSKIPLAALAGVLMVTSAKMVSLRTMRRVTKTGASSLSTYLITLFVTITFDLVIAVVIGLFAASFFALHSLSKMSGATKEDITEEPKPGDERIAVFRIDGSLFFGAADRLIEEVTRISGVDVVILRLSGLQLLDSTGANALAEGVSALERMGITVLIKGVKKEHLAMFKQLGVIDSLRHPNHLFADMTQALAHARSHIKRLEKEPN